MTLSTEPTFRAAPSTAVGPAVNPWLGAALVAALLGLAGSLYLSLGMGLKACPLCFYQRTFMMSLVAVLGIGLISGMGRTGRLGLLALPLAIAGLGVASFHVYLETAGKLECPQGLLGWGTAPQQSLVMFGALTALLLTDVMASRHAGWVRWPLTVGGMVLGGLLAVGSCVSNPPMPAPPAKPYAAAPDICRPPYQPR
jgi:hypothetical protein